MASTLKERREEEKRRNDEATRRLLLAYAQVFGRSGHRTPAQQIVWADMERRGYKFSTTMVPDANTGAIDPQRMSSAEGCRIFHLQTEEFVARAERATEQS